MKKWLEFAKLFAPLLLAQTKFGKNNPELIAGVSQGIVVAESALGAKTGQEKLSKVLEGVEVGLQIRNSITGGATPNPAAVREEAAQAISQVVDTINVFRDRDGDGDYDDEDRRLAGLDAGDAPGGQ